MKKLLAILLTISMIFTLSAAAVAAEEKPLTIHFVVGEEITTVYANYGDDLNELAPSIKREISGGIKYEFGGWETTHKAYAGMIFETLPIITEDDPVSEITFTATYTETEYDGEEIITDIVGDNAVNFLKQAYEKLILFFQEIILMIMGFFAA